MTLKTTKLRDAISIALAVGVTTLAGTGVAFAQDATTPAPTTDADQAKTLDRIEVTGSRIRRVDAENASPVVTIDRQAIEKTGKLGEEVERMTTLGRIAPDLWMMKATGKPVLKNIPPDTTGAIGPVTGLEACLDLNRPGFTGE